MNTFPLGKAAWATRSVSSGLAESGAAGRDIGHLLDRSNLLVMSMTDGNSILHPACAFVSQDEVWQRFAGTWASGPRRRIGEILYTTFAISFGDHGALHPLQ